MITQRSRCEWDESLVRVTESCEDAGCPVHVRFEKLQEPALAESPIDSDDSRPNHRLENLAFTILVAPFIS